MREREESASRYAWIVYTFGTLLVGGLAGYILAQQGGPRTIAASTNSAPLVSTAVVDEGQLRAYRDILARDPRNVQAAVGAGNLLYDAQRYHEAIGFYQQAFAGNPSDINVSTDLGTALWYAGRPDEALAQYEKSLALNATHGQTLFNVGIVRADGKRDYTGAVAAWETLLKTNPTYPDVLRVQSLISDARQKVGDAR
jgi:tetratricopeptide (TPR) repeat protein